MKVPLDMDGLDCRPHDLKPDLWYYEEKKGLSFYRMKDGHSESAGVISWRSIRISLKRHDTGKEKKRRIKKPIERSHRTTLRKSGIVEE